MFVHDFASLEVGVVEVHNTSFLSPNAGIREGVGGTSGIHIRCRSNDFLLIADFSISSVFISLQVLDATHSAEIAQGLGSS